MNRDDGLWNHGEAARGTNPDEGATRGEALSPITNLTLANLLAARTPAWQPKNLAGFNLSSWIGRLRKQNETASDEAEAAFEVVVPSPVSPGTFPDPNRPRYVLVGGGSFGSLVAQVCTLVYPEEFHAGVGAALSNVLTDIHEQSMFTYFSSLLGFKGSGSAYDQSNALLWTLFTTGFQTDYQSLSFANRLRHAQVQRPFFFLFGDEDTVSSGNEMVNLIDPNPIPGSRRLFGSGSWPSVRGSPVEISWTVIPKVCHAPDGGDPYYLPGESTANPPTHEDQDEVAFWMLAKADAERNVPVQPWGSVAVPAKIGMHASLQTFFWHEPKIMNRNPDPRTGTGGSFLQPDPAFRRYGNGTWLGLAESLKVAQVGTGIGASVFTGSADGVITRFVKQTKQVGTVTVEPLEAVARSNVSGADYALGYGVFALDVGTAGSSSAQVVVAASYRRIGIFDAASLNLVQQKDLATLPGLQGPAWEYTEPRRLLLADVVPSTAGNEILFATAHGHLVICDGGLTSVLAEIHENGLHDFVVASGVAPKLSSSYLSTAIFAISARGHVLRFDLDAAKQTFLTAASAPQNGVQTDLELANTAGGLRIATLRVNHPVGEGSIRLFDPTNLNLVSEFADVQNPVTAAGDLLSASRDKDLDDCLSVFYPGGATDPRFAVLSGSRLGITDGFGFFPGFPPSYGDLAQFPQHYFAPARNASALAVGDVDLNTPGHEVVVSTLGGHVVWLKRSEAEVDTTQPGWVWPEQRVVTDANGVVWIDRTNTSLAATWSFAVDPVTKKLHVVEQCGSWWEVDPATGRPTRQRDAIYLVDNNRGLAYSGIVGSGTNPPGTLASSFGGTLDTSFLTQVLSGEHVVKTAPFHEPSPKEPQQWQWRPLSLSLFATQTLGAFWLCPGGVATELNGAQSLAAWRSPNEYANLVTGIRYEPQASSAGNLGLVTQAWNSTGPVLGFGIRPPRSAQPNIYLRTEVAGSALLSLDNLRIGRLTSNAAERQVVVATPGGLVMALDASSGVRIATSDDLGSGGAALALADLTGDGLAEVLVAPAFLPTGGSADPGRSRLSVLQYAATPPRLVTIASVDLPESATDISGYGALGLAVADTANPTTKRIFVTTSGGELLAFEWTYSGTGAFQRMWSGCFEGALGAFSSIHAGNLTSAPYSELYVTGSSGIRKFKF